jgi:hypothetical protein
MVSRARQKNVDMLLTGPGSRPLGREKRAERATNHPSQHI